MYRNIYRTSVEKKPGHRVPPLDTKVINEKCRNSLVVRLFPLHRRSLAREIFMRFRFLRCFHFSSGGEALHFTRVPRFRGVLTFLLYSCTVLKPVPDRSLRLWSQFYLNSREKNLIRQVAEQWVVRKVSFSSSAHWKKWTRYFFLEPGIFLQDQDRCTVSRKHSSH